MRVHRRDERQADGVDPRVRFGGDHQGVEVFGGLAYCGGSDGTMQRAAPATVPG